MTEHSANYRAQRNMHLSPSRPPFSRRSLALPTVVPSTRDEGWAKAARPPALAPRTPHPFVKFFSYLAYCLITLKQYCNEKKPAGCSFKPLCEDV